jgi:hypothetical protein
MKWTSTVAASAISIVSLCGIARADSARADGTRASLATRAERSADVLPPQRLQKAQRLVSAQALTLSPGLVTAAAAPTADEVGDADSFGKNVTYLGLAQTQSVVVTSDCTGTDPATERCILAAAAPATTTFNEANLGSISLPAKASKSLLCFTLTPAVSVSWFNPLATPANARFSAVAQITIDNDLLDDPTILDPATGLPYGGTLTVGLTTFSDLHTLQPGAVDNKNLFMSRSCIAGIISRRALVESYGFTDAQAKDFFKKPMTLSFGARGSVALSDFANYFYGVRLYGD